jgi:hypothetical protein
MFGKVDLWIGFLNIFSALEEIILESNYINFHYIVMSSYISLTFPKIYLSKFVQIQIHSMLTYFWITAGVSVIIIHLF